MVKGVLFDVGGVLIADNNSFVKQSVRQALGIDNATLMIVWDTLIPLLGSGKIDEATFWRQATKEYGVRVVAPGENIFGRPFAQTLKPNTKVLHMAHQLNQYDIRRVILSNTIEAHAKVLHDAGLYDDFDDVLLSHEIGVRKPDAGAFKLALMKTGLEAKDVILVDDREENIKAARVCGIKTIHAIDEDQIVHELAVLAQN